MSTVPYKSVAIEGLKSPIRYQRHATELWVCLRSVCAALGVAWPRWALYFAASVDIFGLREALDDAGRATWLIPSRHGRRLFKRIAPLLEAHRSGYKALTTLRIQWTSVLGLDSGQRVACEESARRGPNRKVTGEAVHAIYEWHQRGITFGAIASQLDLGGETVRTIVAGRYPSTDPEVASAWDDTFGKLNSQDMPARALRGATKIKRTPARRYVDVDLVRKVFVLHGQGLQTKTISEALGYSCSAIAAIVCGSHPFRDEATRAAWHDTFGAAKTNLTGGCLGDRGASGATAASSSSGASEAP